MCSGTETDADKANTKATLTKVSKATPTKSSNTTPKPTAESDERLYCICAQKSHGTMIACDNDDCEIEWFHLACVRLGIVPRKSAKWYCPPCRMELGKGVFSSGIVGGNF